MFSYKEVNVNVCIQYKVVNVCIQSKRSKCVYTVK